MKNYIFAILSVMLLTGCTLPFFSKSGSDNSFHFDNEVVQGDDDEGGADPTIQWVK